MSVVRSRGTSHEEVYLTRRFTRRSGRIKNWRKKKREKEKISRKKANGKDGGNGETMVLEEKVEEIKKDMGSEEKRPRRKAAALPPQETQSERDSGYEEVIANMTEQELRDARKKAMRNARERQKRKEAAKAAGREYNPRGASKQDAEFEEWLIKTVKPERGTGGVILMSGAQEERRGAPREAKSAPAPTSGLITTGGRDAEEPEYVYDLEKDGYDSDEWAEQWELDVLTCTDWPLRFAKCKTSEGSGFVVGANGALEESTNISLIHPVAFCGLHNPDRDKHLMGWPAGGSGAKGGHPFEILKRTSPPFANEAINKWTSAYEKNQEIKEKRKRHWKKTPYEEASDNAEGTENNEPTKIGKITITKHIERSDSEFDSEAEEQALVEEIEKEQAKLDALKAKLKKKRRKSADKRAASAMKGKEEVLAMKGKEDNTVLSPVAPSPVPPSPVASSPKKRAPARRPVKRSESGESSKPKKGDDGWDSAQEELELQMEILREQEAMRMPKKRRGKGLRANASVFTPFLNRFLTP